jgi:hypothetical protein
VHRSIVLACCVLLLVSPCRAAKAPSFVDDGDYGKLTIFSDIPGADIYVDAKFVGQDRAAISNIPAGKHYVRVVKEENTIQSGLVDVKEGEETIIVAKPTGDELLSKSRKPNHVLLFGNMSSVGYYEVNPGGTYDYAYRPQWGVGTEIKFALPVVDINIDLGFFLNYPSAIVAGSGEAQMAISSPYICVGKDIAKAGPFKIGVGGGFNYGIFNAGGGTTISISSRLGYMAYIEAMRNLGASQKIAVKLGYLAYNGKSTTTAGAGDVSCNGYFLQVGIAYPL